MFILVIMGLICQYHGQVIGWKDFQENLLQVHEAFCTKMVIFPILFLYFDVFVLFIGCKSVIVFSLQADICGNVVKHRPLMLPE